MQHRVVGQQLPQGAQVAFARRLQEGLGDAQAVLLGGREARPRSRTRSRARNASCRQDASLRPSVRATSE